MPLLIFIYSYGVANMQIWTVLTKSQSRVSDTQVAVKTLGPLVFFSLSLKVSIIKMFNLFAKRTKRLTLTINVPCKTILFVARMMQIK